MLRRWHARRFLASFATCIAVALFLMWVTSPWYWAHAVVWRALTLDVSRGQIVIGWYPVLSERRPMLRWWPPNKDLPIRWWFCYSHETAFWWFGTPAWAPSVAAAAGAWYLRRAARAAGASVSTETCSACAYDRRGLNTGAACPECGTEPAPPTTFDPRS